MFTQFSSPTTLFSYNSPNSLIKQSSIISSRVWCDSYLFNCVLLYFWLRCTCVRLSFWLPLLPLDPCFTIMPHTLTFIAKLWPPFIFNFLNNSLSILILDCNLFQKLLSNIYFHKHSSV